MCKIDPENVSCGWSFPGAARAAFLMMSPCARKYLRVQSGGNVRAI